MWVISCDELIPGPFGTAPPVEFGIWVEDQIGVELLYYASTINDVGIDWRIAILCGHHLTDRAKIFCPMGDLLLPNVHSFLLFQLWFRFLRAVEYITRLIALAWSDRFSLGKSTFSDFLIVIVVIGWVIGGIVSDGIWGIRLNFFSFCLWLSFHDSFLHFAIAFLHDLNDWFSLKIR